MDAESDSGLWTRVKRLFGHDDGDDVVEKAIQEAREEGELDPEEGSMLMNVLELNEFLVQDLMTPRTDFACADVTSTVRDVVKIIVESGHSRIPVYRDTRDNIVGMAYAKDLLTFLSNPETADAPIGEALREPFFVPETKKVVELLQEFRSRKLHMAIALDEYGGTSGLVTIEDVIEVIVGDIEDEYDAPKIEEIQDSGNGILLLAGRALLEDLEKYGISLQSEEVETIGGYLSQLAGHVPQAGEQFILNGRVFTVLEADHKLIRSIKVVPEDMADGKADERAAASAPEGAEER